MDRLSCPACGTYSGPFEITWVLRTGRGRNEWARCMSCKAYFLAGEYSLPDEIVHTRGMGWGSRDLGIFLNEFKSRMFASVLKLLLEYAPPPASLLDIGCSFGGFLMKAKKAGYVVVGTDIVPEAVAYVRKHGISAEVCSDIGEISIAQDDSFDIVSILDCNCYWADQLQQLKHARAKMKPGGFLIMRVVNKSWMFSIGLRLYQIHRALGERVVWKAVNDHRFSMPLKSLLALIQNLGFETVYVRPKGAVHGDQTSLPVKFAFAFGDLMWRALNISCAPGAILLARKHLS